jgi:hypothetical protein
MVEVADAQLLEGHTFSDKEIVLMRIVEEANLYGVRIKIIRSDGLQVDTRSTSMSQPCQGNHCYRSTERFD